MSEKTRMPGKPIADDDDRDDSDSDASEILHEPEAELIGDDTVVDVDVIVPQGNDAA